MRKNFRKSLALVLQHEGGWSDHPRDPGGATMRGVTLYTYRRYYGADRTPAQLRQIRDDELAHIYRQGYWDTCRCDALPDGVDYAVFDAAVNSGPGRSARWLQAAVGAHQDGGIGPRTLERVPAHAPVRLIDDLCARRLKFLQGLGTWVDFGRGWAHRVAGVRGAAMAMSGAESAMAELVPEVKFRVSRRGSRGAWVRKLQVGLGLQVDGYFGVRTQEVLKAWQSEQGLEPDGIAGPVTYRALGLLP